MHLIFRAKENNPGDVLGSFKTYTSKSLQKLIEENTQESRKEWVLWMFKRAGSKNSNVKNGQLWQQNNKPIELWSSEVIDQKVDYIHNNPVESGFVNEPWHWRYSSAMDYSGGKGVLEIDFISFNRRYELQARTSSGLLTGTITIPMETTLEMTG
jgi:REP element-mobilizing transposase RayT